ncbi:MAG: VIT family protein [Candidatus Paceibacterota bacterium]|jgi:VIT1/CCC1 family predicted Fe2+/Mn2+ transporter
MLNQQNFQKRTEPHNQKIGKKLNWLRASVLGANDGIVSIAALVVGVAGASNSSGFILIAGIAGIVAGSISMGVGEYVSVSAQRDTEKALIEKERQELADSPELELEELVDIYTHKGLSVQTARIVAEELTAHGALAAHLDAELNIDESDLVSPLHAAYASTLAFLCGAIFPIVMIIIPPASLRIPVTFLGVLIALTITGMLSAYAGGADKKKAAIRLVFGGMLAMAVTFGIGKLFGVAGI